MSQSIYSRVRVSRAERRRMERLRQQRLEAERQRRAEARRRAEEERQRQLEAVRRAAIGSETERLALERAVLAKARQAARGIATTPDPATVAHEEVRTELVDAYARLDVLIERAGEVGGDELATQAQALSGRLNAIAVHDNLAAHRDHVTNIRAEIDSLWASFDQLNEAADEQQFVVDNVTAVLDQLGYRVTCPARREQPDHASPVYIDFAAPNGPTVQIGITPAGQMVAEVIPAATSAPDPAAATSATDPAKATPAQAPAKATSAQDPAAATARWCRDYDAMSTALAARGVDCELKLRQGHVDDPASEEALRAAVSVAATRGRLP